MPTAYEIAYVNRAAREMLQRVSRQSMVLISEIRDDLNKITSAPAEDVISIQARKARILMRLDKLEYILREED